MANAFSNPPKHPRLQPSTDWWAVIAALALALLVRLGIVQRVPW